MKYLLSVIFLLHLCISLSADEYTMTGVYHGKNLFVQNSLLSEKNEQFCISKVTVNGIEIPDQTESSAFIISLDFMDIELGESIQVVFTHHANCAPIVINSEVLQSISTFEVVGHELRDGYIYFETSNEASALDFTFEQYRWEKWVEIDKQKGYGGPENNEYKIQVFPHNGMNLFRLKQVDDFDRVRTSETIKVFFQTDEIRLLSPKHVRAKIQFSGETMYELVNEFGERIKSGIGSEVDVSEVTPGKYYISWDNQAEHIQIG